MEFTGDHNHREEREQQQTDTQTDTEHSRERSRSPKKILTAPRMKHPKCCKPLLRRSTEIPVAWDASVSKRAPAVCSASSSSRLLLCCILLYGAPVVYRAEYPYQRMPIRELSVDLVLDIIESYGQITKLNLSTNGEYAADSSCIWECESSSTFERAHIL